MSQALFHNPVTASKFRATNGPWNQLRLNAPWSVGYVSTLITLKSFAHPQEWEAFYYEMGAVRQRKMQALSAEQRDFLCNDAASSQQVKKLARPLQNLNYQHGRTEAELRQKGHRLAAYLQAKGEQLSAEEGFQCVRFRVIGETWNGIIGREQATLRKLQQQFPQLTFQHTSGDVDHQYAVDFEIYRDEQLLGALQVKPPSYCYQTDYLQRARQANQRKQAAYFQQFGCKVWEVIAEQDGTLRNQEVLQELKQLSKG